MRAAYLVTLAACAVVLFTPTQLNAQSAEEDVAAVIETLFDAMRSGDGATVERLFHENMRLMSVGTNNGEMVLSEGQPADFAAAVGSPRNEIWDERVSNLVIQVDGDLAAAWMNYSFFVDDLFSHCGVNAFQLVRTAEGWRILQITDTRRMGDCG